MLIFAVSDAGLSASDKDARIPELEAALATARADITARDILIDTLRVQLARLKRMHLLARIASLYRIEDEIRGAPSDVRRRGRLERTAPLIEA